MSSQGDLGLAMTKLSVEQVRQQYMDQALRWHLIRTAETLAAFADRMEPDGEAGKDLRQLAKSLSELFC